MTASLYQRARSVDDCSLFASATSRISLSADNTEHVRGKGLRVEAHVVAPAVPGIAPAAEQVFDLVLAALARREVDPAGLREPRIEVDDGEHQVLALLLGVGDQVIVVGGVELQAPVRLQREIFLSDLIQPLNQ